MTPAARVQAAIDLLDAITVAARDAGPAADTLIARYFAARRYAGSKDRRAVRELVYRAVRLAGERPASGRAAMLLLAQEDPDISACFDGSTHGPAPIDPAEPVAAAGPAPRWLVDRLTTDGLDSAEVAALVGRAPLDLRVNSLRPGALDLTDAQPVPGVPGALRLPSGTAVEGHPAFLSGAVEVQDAGSQAVCAVIPATPGVTVVDLCAGAGGKSLALAAAMHDQGRIIACDIDRDRLSRLAPRAARAGATIVETRLLNPGREMAALEDLAGQADAVLVDAPCSGTGTWRRNPEARWRLSPERISRLARTQAALLDLAAMLVRPGGTLGYVVCSLLDEEGAAQVDDFLMRHPGWRPAPCGVTLGRLRGVGTRLTPAHDGTDGFFVARLLAPC